MKNLSSLDRLRKVVLTPDNAPTFILTTYDTGRTDNRGQTVIAYKLCMGGSREPLFQGDGFAGSPLHADDSDATCRALLGFLTLRPGDTDADYFASYTPAQLEFVEQYAEALALEVEDRFGER